MLKAVNAKDFEQLAAWSVDRLGRSLTDLLSILQGLRDKGVDLFLHQQGLDTSTTAGRAMFQMLGVFAEFERGIIRERVNAGLARAKANGTKLGRRRVKPSVEARILELRANGDGILKIGKKLGIGTRVVDRVFKQEPWQSESNSFWIAVHRTRPVSCFKRRHGSLVSLQKRHCAAVPIVQNRCIVRL